MQYLMVHKLTASLYATDAGLLSVVFNDSLYSVVVYCDKVMFLQRYFENAVKKLESLFKKCKVM